MIERTHASGTGASRLTGRVGTSTALCYNRALGQVAQLVEQRTENPCVGGSIPPLATRFRGPRERLAKSRRGLNSALGHQISRAARAARKIAPRFELRPWPPIFEGLHAEWRQAFFVSGGGCMAQVDFATLKQSLYTAVLSDVLDSLGYMHQAMRPFVRPLDEDSVIMGRARTGLWMNVFSVKEGENPYEHEMALLDDLKPGRRRGVRLRRSDGSRGAVGRTPVDGGHLPRRGSVRHRRPRPRREEDPRDALSGLPRRHRSPRLQGTRQDGGHRRADRMRRRGRARRRCRVRRRGRRRGDSGGDRRRSDREGARQGRGARTARATNCCRGACWPRCTPSTASCSPAGHGGCQRTVRNARYGDGVGFAGH